MVRGDVGPVITYIDTSAAMKLLVQEDGSDAVAVFLQAAPDRVLVSSWLLHTELHRAARRHPDAVRLVDVSLVLETANLVDLTRGDLLTASALPGRLRSHDAVHLAVALRVAADEMVTYDDELAEAARSAGLAVVAPR